MIAKPIIQSSMIAPVAAQLVCRHSADTRLARRETRMGEVLDLTGSPGWGLPTLQNQCLAGEIG